MLSGLINFMSKRNFILLIIVLIIVGFGVFGYFYFNQGTTDTTGNNTTDTNFFSQFNPFGNVKTKPPVVTPPTDVSTETPPTPTTVVLKLNKISSMPIAGFTTFSKERLKVIPVIAPTTDSTTSTTPATTPVVNVSKVKKTIGLTTPPTEFSLAVRYVAKSTGNIYESFADKIEESRYSTTIIPRVYDAYFGNKGNSVVMRYLKADGKTIETFFGNIPKESFSTSPITDNEIKGSLLPNDIKDLSLSADLSGIFYLFNSGDNMIGTTFNFLNNRKVQIFTSPFTEWLSGWPNNKMITLTTKPSYGTPGYMYTIDSNGKNFTQVLGDINGLTTLTSPNGKLVLYGDNNLTLNIYHTDKNISDLLGVKTMPEKCVWGSSNDFIYCAVPKSIDAGQYPDSWYQGEVSFSDQIWKIDIKTGKTTMIIDPATVGDGGEVDGIKLSLDSNENYLFFVNKKDSFLWELNLK